MKQFEATWREKFEFFERVYDTDLQRSIKRKVDLPYEWFEENSRGLYSSILDEKVRLEKKQGSSKQGRDNYGYLAPDYRNIRDNYWNKEDGYNNIPKIWYLDIETRVGTCSSGFPVPEKAAEPISLIQIYDNKENVIIMLGLRDWKHQARYKEQFEYPVKYVKCNDEIHLIETYLGLFKKLDPLIIYAWNGDNFDFPYIHNRLKNLGMNTNQMSNYGNVSYSEREFQNQLEFSIKTDGHFYIDLMQVYKKFVFAPRPSYSLDTISQIELGERKVEHSEYAGFDAFYTGDYILPKDPTEEQLNSDIYQEVLKNGLTEEARELAHSEFCFYGYKDPLLIKKIDDKQNFTTLMLMIASKMGVTLGDSLGTVKPWAQYISNKSMLDMKVMPSKGENDDPHVVGGYVRDPQKGKHKWVLSADVNSMYPLLGMVGFNMSPETYIPKHKLPPELRDIVLQYFNDQDEFKRFSIPPEIWAKTTELLKEHKLSLGINGAVFTAEKEGMVPEMIQEIYKSRKIAKKTMFKYETQKVLIKQILKERL